MGGNYLHTLQALVLRTCNENIHLNNEIAQLRDELKLKDVLIKKLRRQLTNAGSSYEVESLEVRSEGSTASSITVSKRENSFECIDGEWEDEDPTVSKCDDDDVESSALDDNDVGDSDVDVSSSSVSSPCYDNTADFSGPCTLNIDALDMGDFFSVPAAIEEMHKWFFLRGGHSLSIKEFISQYSVYMREVLGIPVDRVFLGCIAVNPKVSVYTWKWQNEQEVRERELPQEQWDKRRVIFKDTPLLLFCDGRANRIRMKASLNPPVPEDCKWFQEEGYEDYYALPLYHQGELVGAMTWSTKKDKGFSQKHLEFFARHLHALTTFVRLHTNEIVLATLANKMEEEVNQRTAELAKANRRIMVQSAAQLKNFACMSHEIRTPLNCIIGLSSLMVDTDLDENQRESLRMIVRSGDLLLSVVNDVLDYSRLESGNVEINFEPTDLRAVLDLILKSMGPRMKARKISITNNWDSALPASIVTDGSRLQQILYNLLGNAVKFSRDGGTIHFTVGLEERSIVPPKIIGGSINCCCHKVVRMSIKDFGKGIAPSDLSTIFEPFNQGTGPTSRDYGGTGLGLAITANLVKALNGTISVDSELHKWSEFVVELPCEDVSPPPEHDENYSSSSPESPLSKPRGTTGKVGSPASFALLKSGFSTNEGVKTSGTVVDRRLAHLDSCSGLQSLSSSADEDYGDGGACNSIPERISCSNQIIERQGRILVVDDNLVNRKVLVRMLERMGAVSIDTAGDGLEACELEARNVYDLILMDMEMPVMDGLEACQRILLRERPLRNHPPKVVFVTAHALDTFHAKAMEVGGSGFLTKPFHLKKLKTIFKEMDLHVGARQVPV